MPMVRKMIHELSGKEPDVSVSADEAVAQGAALHAGICLARTQGNRVGFQIRNVNSHSLGVVATDGKTGRKRNAILIPRNTTLPVTAKRVFKTSQASQRSILVQIVEGESASPEDCSQLGKCVVRDLPANLPSDTPIEVQFRYADNGRLGISVKVVGTNTELKHEINRENSLTPEQLDTWREYISGTTAHPQAAQST
jgi:molecular chaperone DnaK